MSNFGKIIEDQTVNDPALLLDHKVLVFKNINIEDEESFIKVFAAAESSILVDEDYDYSFFAPLQNAGPGEYGYYARWQNDLCWDIKVADICVMKIVESVGQSNLISWVDLEKVRNLLDPKIVDFITKHNITGWNIKNPRDLHQRQSQSEYKHPALRIHPETNKESVFYSGPSTIGKDNDVWQEYLAYLLEFFQDEQNVFSTNWSTGDIIVWDNRCTTYSINAGPGSKIKKIIAQGSKPVWY
jgi:hypothetical protein